MSRNDAETTKNICCAKDGGAFDHSAVTGVFEEFRSECRNLEDQARSDRLKQWTPRLWSKPWRQIRQVALGDYQVSSAYHNPMWSGKSIQSC